MSRFDSNLIVPTPSESVAKQEHTDKITADEPSEGSDVAPKTESDQGEIPESEPTPDKGYGLSLELVEFDELNYDEEIFGIPEDQHEQTFGQEYAEGDDSEVSEEEMTELESTPESRSRAQLQTWLDALEQVTFGSQAGDVEAGNLLRQRLAELEQKVLREEAEENQAADQGIIKEMDPEVEDLVDIQDDQDNEIVEQASAEVPRRLLASKIVEAPRRLNYIMLPEEVPRAEPVKGKNRKEIDDYFRRLLEEDSEDDETEEEDEARLIAENNARWERCLEYRRKYCEEYGSDGEGDDRDEPPQDFRGNSMHKDDPSDDEEFYANKNSIWE